MLIAILLIFNSRSKIDLNITDFEITSKIIVKTQNIKR